MWLVDVCLTSFTVLVSEWARQTFQPNNPPERIKLIDILGKM